MSDRAALSDEASFLDTRQEMHELVCLSCSYVERLVSSDAVVRDIKNFGKRGDAEVPCHRSGAAVYMLDSVHEIDFDHILRLPFRMQFPCMGDNFRHVGVFVFCRLPFYDMLIIKYS